MCYEMQLETNAHIRETAIEVEIDILKGSVSAVSIERNEATGMRLALEALGQCVQKNETVEVSTRLYRYRSRKIFF